MLRNRSRVARLQLMLAISCIVGSFVELPSIVLAQHGRFDRTEINPRDEAYVFTPAGFERAGVAAEADPKSSAQLKVTIVDAGTQKPTPCRVNVIGSDGNFYQPRDNPLRAYSLTGTWPETLAGNRPGKAPIRYFGHFFYTRGEFAVEVPPGPVRIEVWKGFEFRPEQHSTHVASGEARDVELTLTTAVPMAKQGWHSGDPHLHFIRANDRDDETIFDLIEAEDMRMGLVLCYNEDTSNYRGLMPAQATPQLRGLGAQSDRRRGAYQITSGQEYRNGVLGHLNLFRRDRIVLDGAQLDPNNGPLFAEVARETRDQGGYAFHAHGGYGLEIWADLVQGATTGVELLQFGIYRGIGLEGWYHVLNAGFRFPGLAACDYPACRKLGDCRTYAYVEGEPTFDSWLKAVAEGRSFMTTAPLVLLEVDGHRPGDVINLAGAKANRLRARVRVRSETAPVTNVQLIVGGQVLRELVVTRESGSGQWLELNEPVQIDRSTWVAARAFSTAPGGAADAEAHTNPVYVEVDGKKAFSIESTDWLIARLDEQIADQQRREAPEKQRAIDHYQLSRQVLVELKAKDSQTVTPDREAARRDEIRRTIVQPVLDEGAPLAELRAFVEPRIIAMPEIKDRATWDKAAAALRRDMLEKVVFRGFAREWRDARTRVEWFDTIAGGPGYTIRKLRYEALPGTWIPALLYAPAHVDGRVPLVLHLNGHTREGKATDYKQLLSINLAKRGMLVLDPEWFGMGQLATPGFSHYRMNQVDLCGAAGLAPFYLAMSRALDVGLALENADPARVAVAGLSGGGWQTILISALDERVTLANPVAGYGSFRTNIAVDDLGDSEQAPTDMAVIADYAHLTALRAPRPTLLTYNATDDCCFKAANTLAPLMAAALPAFSLYGADNRLWSHVNHDPGTHNFDKENRERFYAAIGEVFYPGDKAFSRQDVPARDDLKSAEQLLVPLPDDNVDFHRLALQLAERGSRLPALPKDAPEAITRQRERRLALASLLRVPGYVVDNPPPADARHIAEFDISARKIICRDAGARDSSKAAWTIPCIEIAARNVQPRKAVILLADQGREAASDEARRHIAAGARVLVVDLMGLGESRVVAQDPPYLFPLFIATVGERPLGIQAAQLGAIARWQRQAHPAETIEVAAIGPRASIAALVAAAIEVDAIAQLELREFFSTLKQLIERDKTVETLPELFAFGLLAEFDIAEIVALVAPRPVRFRAADERTHRELAPLRAWYTLLGTEFDPLSGG